MGSRRNAGVGGKRGNPVFHDLKTAGRQTIEKKLERPGGPLLVEGQPDYFDK